MARSIKIFFCSCSYTAHHTPLDSEGRCWKKPVCIHPYVQPSLFKMEVSAVCLHSTHHFHITSFPFPCTTWSQCSTTRPLHIFLLVRQPSREKERVRLSRQFLVMCALLTTHCSGETWLGRRSSFSLPRQFRIKPPPLLLLFPFPSQILCEPAQKHFFHFCSQRREITSNIWGMFCLTKLKCTSI